MANSACAARSSSIELTRGGTIPIRSRQATASTAECTSALPTGCQTAARTPARRSRSRSAPAGPGRAGDDLVALADRPASSGHRIADPHLSAENVGAEGLGDHQDEATRSRLEQHRHRRLRDPRRALADDTPRGGRAAASARAHALHPRRVLHPLSSAPPRAGHHAPARPSTSLFGIHYQDVRPDIGKWTEVRPRLDA